jgi:uncharacterized protein YcaQ
VWFHLGDPTRLERLDEVGHALPEIRHLLDSTDHSHRSRIIELMFDSKYPVGPPWRSLCHSVIQSRDALLLSPFDRLVHDRGRTLALFDFEYVLEMYRPARDRRWGYFALPVLHHDRLVGKLDAKADRKAGTFIVNALHEDVQLTTAMRADVEAEIEALAAWLRLKVTRA